MRLFILLFILASSTYSQFRLSAGYVDNARLDYHTPLFQVGSDEHTFVTGMTVKDGANLKNIIIGYNYKFTKLFSAGAYTEIGNTGKWAYTPFVKFNYSRYGLVIGGSFTPKQKVTTRSLVFGVMIDVFH